MSNHHAKPLSLIIPVRNEGIRIVRTVESIVRGRSCNFPIEIVIVDDASIDGACERLSQIVEDKPEVTLVVRRLSTWSGIPFARNRGAEIANHPIHFITDGNTWFPPNWDLPIWRHFRRDRVLAATILDMSSSFCGYGCQLVLPSMGATWIAVAGAYGGYVPVTACTGTVIDGGLFHHLGGYDETLPLYGAAEPELSVRAWLAGYEIVNVPELQLYHHFRPRAAHDAFWASNRLLLSGNYLRFACYYLPDDLLARCYDYYANLASEPRNLDNSIASPNMSDVWSRRAELEQLPRDFRWYLNRFGLLSSSPRYSTNRLRS
jgi:glycosyltransferase involved in cell wall biosynthesis